MDASETPATGRNEASTPSGAHSRRRATDSGKGDEKRAPESIEVILDRWLRRNRVKDRVDPDEVFLRWREVAGPEIGEHTRVVDLQSAVLIVEVDSAPLLHELATYHTKILLDALRATKEGSHVRELKFRAGSFGG